LNNSSASSILFFADEIDKIQHRLGRDGVRLPPVVGLRNSANGTLITPAMDRPIQES
jgi:hypothetical protein